MFRAVLNAFRIKEVRNRILFTIGSNRNDGHDGFIFRRGIG